MKIRMKICLAIFVTAWVFVHGGCATFKPPSIADVPFQERAQTQQKNGVRVNAAVLSEKESRAAFGVPLYSKGVQPVWIEIANSRNEPVWFLPYGIDPDYFAPLEVAYKFEFGYSKKGTQELNRHFFKNGVRAYVSPESTRSGFVFTNLDQGTKSFNVDVINDDKSLETFTFFIAVPGLKVDHHQVDFEQLYPADQVVTLDEEGLRKALKELPCCTYDKKGTEKGDPLNLIFIGNPDEVYYALIRAGWDETETDIRCITMENGDVFSLRRSLPLFSRQCALRFRPASGCRLSKGPRLDPRKKPPPDLVGTDTICGQNGLGRPDQSRYRRTFHNQDHHDPQDRSGCGRDQDFPDPEPVVHRRT